MHSNNEGMRTGGGGYANGNAEKSSIDIAGEGTRAKKVRRRALGLACKPGLDLALPALRAVRCHRVRSEVVVERGLRLLNAMQAPPQEEHRTQHRRHHEPKLRHAT